MRHDVVFFVAAIFLCFSASAWGKQASDAPTPSQVENQPQQTLRAIASVIPRPHRKLGRWRKVTRACPWRNPMPLAL